MFNIIRKYLIEGSDRNKLNDTIIQPFVCVLFMLTYILMHCWEYIAFTALLSEYEGKETGFIIKKINKL